MVWQQSGSSSGARSRAPVGVAGLKLVGHPPLGETQRGLIRPIPGHENPVVDLATTIGEAQEVHASWCVSNDLDAHRSFDPAIHAHRYELASWLVPRSELGGSNRHRAELAIAVDEFEENVERWSRSRVGGDRVCPSGVGRPACPIGNATLIVASDGLLRYAKQQDIERISRGPDLATAARSLVELVRLPSRALQDDVAVVLCRDLG